MTAPATNREVTVRAPGKVNLQLAVGPVRDDGYHPLATVFQAVDLYEVVTASARLDGQTTLTVTGAQGIDVAGVPLDETNLAWRAAVAPALTPPLQAAQRRSGGGGSRSETEGALAAGGGNPPPHACVAAAACWA